MFSVSESAYKIFCLCESYSKFEDIHYVRERTRRNIPEQITSVFYLYDILFRMYERSTAAEKAFDTILQISLDCVLAQRLKQSTKLTAKVTNTAT